MALSLVQHQTATATASQNTLAVTVTALTAGNLVVVGVAGSSSESVNSIGDGGNTYTQCASAKVTEAGGRWTDLWYAKNVSGGSTTVTVTYSATTANRKAVEVWEVSGADVSAPLDTSNGGTGTGGAGNKDTGASMTTGTADAFLCGIIRTAGSVVGMDASDVVFTSNDLMGGGGDACSAIVAATGTYTPIWSDGVGSASFANSVGAFKIASGGGGGATSGGPCTMTLMGVQ